VLHEYSLSFTDFCFPLLDFLLRLFGSRWLCRRLCVPVVYDLYGEDDVYSGRAHVGEYNDLVARLLDGGEDADDGTGGKQEHGCGRQLTGVAVAVV
jgi:hypothetical protein